MNTVMIRRYNNRKLYLVGSCRYIKLQDITNYLREGKNVVVLDHMTQEDVTRQTLNEAFHKTNTLSVEVLTNLIRGV